MPDSVAIAAQGFDIAIQTAVGPPAVYQSIEEVTAFNGFDGQAAEIDKTNLKSTAKEWLMGLQDFGNFNIDVSYVKDASAPGQAALRAAKASRALKTFKVTFSDASTATFKAYVMNAPVSGSVDSKVDSSFTLRISGDVTFA
jgi:predicted secreted protein